MKQVINILVIIFLSSAAFGQSSSLKVGDKWPYSNAHIRNVTDTVHLYNFKFHEGFSKVTYNGKVGFINLDKTIVIPLIYDDELMANEFIYAKSIVVMEGKWGVIDTANTTIFPCLYNNIQRYNDLYYLELGQEWGYGDSTGKIILPLNTYACSHLMTKQEIFALADKTAEKKVEENAAPISKNKAIAVAKRKGYYYEGEFAFNPSVELDTKANEWLITSTKSLGRSERGDCANTNGCTVLKEAVIVIDSNTGQIKRKSKTKYVYPNYE